MNAAVSLMDGLGLDGDRCIHVIPRQSYLELSLLEYKDHKKYKNCEVTNHSQTIMPPEAKGKFALPFG